MAILLAVVTLQIWHHKQLSKHFTKVISKDIHTLEIKASSEAREEKHFAQCYPRRPLAKVKVEQTTSNVIKCTITQSKKKKKKLQGLRGEYQ